MTMQDQFFQEAVDITMRDIRDTLIHHLEVISNKLLSTKYLLYVHSFEIMVLLTYFSLHGHQHWLPIAYMIEHCQVLCKF